MSELPTNVGRASLILKGNYNPATTYYRLDVVSYNGGTFAAKKQTTGNLPTNAEFWQCLAMAGQTAATTPITDAGGYFTTDTVEAALQQLGKHGHTAADVKALPITGGTITGNLIVTGDITGGNKRVTSYPNNGGTVDFNAMTAEWGLYNAGGANAPPATGDTFWYVNTIHFSDGVKRQVAYGHHTNRVFTRRNNNGWGAWKEILTEGGHRVITLLPETPAINLNDVAEEWILARPNYTNIPAVDRYYYLHTVWAATYAGAPKMQIAYGYFVNDVYYRSFNQGGWTAWRAL